MAKEVCTDCNGAGHVGGAVCKVCEGFGYFQDPDSDEYPDSDPYPDSGPVDYEDDYDDLDPNSEGSGPESF